MSVLTAFDADVLIYCGQLGHPLGERVLALFPDSPNEIAAGAKRFLTNNRGDFPKTITEIDVIYPDDLPTPGELTPR